MKVSAQELRLHDARTHELGFLAAALGAFGIAAAILQWGYSNSGHNRANLANEGVAELLSRRARNGFEGARLVG
jgi:hypothetical protein